jgi:uncharacterized membrane protein YraQ (UPF0718 family)
MLEKPRRPDQAPRSSRGPDQAPRSSRLRETLRRYGFFLVLLLINLLLLLFFPVIGRESFRITGESLLDVLLVLPPIFIILGLADVWIDRETMMRFLGEKAGLRGILIAFLMGAMAAGPLYAAFPVTRVMIKKGAKLSNVFIFIGAWSCTKIPQLLFETANLGLQYMLVRFAGNVVGILLIAFVLDRLTSAKERIAIAKRNEE